MYPLPHNDANYHAQGYPGHMNISSSPRPPAYIASGHGVTARWSTGLCHCCDDPASSLITCFCPCVTFGQIAEIVNKGATSCEASGFVYGMLCLVGLPCFYSCFYRSKLRGEYDLEETPFADCLVHCCCETCALCQEYRELRNRGFDMSIGWEANMDRQRRGITTAPSTNAGGMKR